MSPSLPSTWHLEWQSDFFIPQKDWRKKKIYELEKSMDRKIIYTPKEGVENGAQRMTSKNSIKLLNSNTEGLKTMKQCLKNCKGIFTFGNVHKVLILTWEQISNADLKNYLPLTFNQEVNGNVGMLEKEVSIQVRLR